MAYYDEQKRVNIFLLNKFRALLSGEEQDINILKMKLEITTEHAVSMGYVDKRIDYLVSIYPAVKKEDGFLFVVPK